MKLTLIILSLFFATIIHAQTDKDTDKEAVAKACMTYIEGFYEGDTMKIINCLKPTLHKFGFWKDRDTGKYKGDGYMTFDQAKAYAKNVLEKKRFPKKDAPREVVVLDIMNHIAAARITAWWGSDYLLLSRVDDKWIIEQALWEGPLVTKK